MRKTFTPSVAQPAGITLVRNPPNPYHRYAMEWLDVPPHNELKVYEERARSIITKNNSPDISFTYSINPYRGCFHGCAYCYARPTHQYLDFGAGSDFERKIVVKVNAPELLHAAFMKKSWQGDRIIFSGVTDCYQPLEASYEVTRRCLEKCLEFGNPVQIITKGALVRRDKALLSELDQRAGAGVAVSITFADDRISKLMEPFAPRPSIRFQALKELSEAGIPTTVGVAPIIPGLNDSDIPEILERAKECGAQTAFMTLLRLPLEVRDVFTERVTEAFPTKAAKVLSQVKDMKGGVLNKSDFGNRMKGDGTRWEAIHWMFENTCKKLGLNKKNPESKKRSINTNSFKRPTAQMDLF